LLEENGIADPVRTARALELVDSICGFDEAVARVDLVIESAAENMEFKQNSWNHRQSSLAHKGELVPGIRHSGSVRVTPTAGASAQLIRYIATR
jgi:hypothetical protein